MDIYSEIAEVKSPTDRRIAKLALLIFLNASEEKAGKFAINGEISSLSQAEKQDYSLGTGAVLWKAMQDWFDANDMPIKQDYQGDNNIGLTLQNYDSELAAIVIERLRMAGVPTLVVHDSFIVKEINQYFAEQVMAEAFKIMFDDTTKVPLTIEYKREGVVHKDRKTI